MNQPLTPPTEEKFKEMLKAHGLKATAQRLAVHKAMLELGHASADMVSEFAADNIDSKLTVSSVYNILTQMAGLGIYRRRLSANSKMYFDVNPGKHVHLYDTQSNEYKDVVEQDWISDIEEQIKRHHFKGYKVDGVEITILCHPSRKKKNTVRKK